MSEKWTTVGSFKHNLPDGKHQLYGQVIDTKTVTEEELAEINARGSVHVKPAPASKEKTPSA
jgi:hypothetical protein